MRGWHLAAIVAGTKGLNGKLRLADASAFLLSADGQVEAAFVPPRDDAPRFSHLCAIESLSGDSCVAAFEGIEDVDVAARLAGCSVLVKAKIADAPAVTEMGDMTGFAVCDGEGNQLGVVRSVEWNRHQPLVCMVVSSDGKDVYVPFVDAIVTDVDERMRRMVVDLPRGLMDL